MDELLDVTFQTGYEAGVRDTEERIREKIIKTLKILHHTHGQTDVSKKYCLKCYFEKEWNL